MPRISLVEAYNNRDVIAWLVKHQDAIDEMMNILQNINPDGDLTNIVLKTGDQTIDGVKTFIGKIVANCDIIQNGAAYETHAEQIFTKNDYIVMRDGALGGLQPGEFSGFRINRFGIQTVRDAVFNKRGQTETAEKRVQGYGCVKHRANPTFQRSRCRC